MIILKKIIDGVKGIFADLPDAEAEREAQLRIDYRIAFTTPEGQRVLEDLCRHCHLLEPTFIPESDRWTAFREGQRNVLLYILDHARLVESGK